MLALCEPGDEVLTFEPSYDSYAAAAAMAGAALRVVTLEPPDLAVDLDRLAASITPRTRLLLLNSPHNPLGKVFGRDELTAIAALCVEHDLLAVTDEVYEHLVYDGEHLPLTSFPGMAERTLTISSAGKTFCFTGWKIGWVCGPAPLVAAVRTAKQFLTYVNGAPFQPAVVVGLGLPDSYFTGLRDGLAAKRDRLCAGLTAAGFLTFEPAGTYFVTVDARSVGFDDGVELCRVMPERCGVVAVPSAAFYLHPERGRHLVRFAFCKRDEVLDEACERLSRL
jgi:N-succinyldiaminopimelate aminotransferase